MKPLPASLPLRAVGGLAILALLAACDTPRGAPMQAEILSSAKAAESGIAVYPVTREALPRYAAWPATGLQLPDRWLPRTRGPASPVLAPGDVVEITIWDSEENSLLASATQKQVPLGSMVVSAGGTVFVPYVEEVQVAGLTPEAARRTIQRELSAIVPSGQVQLRLVSSRVNSVDVVSGVAKPGTIPLQDRNTTLLSVLSQAGGVPAEMRNPQVRLLREGRSYGIALARLFEDPTLDTTLQGGDKIVVEPDPRYFVALGAAGREEIVHFPTERVTALEAASLVGGVNDARGNPKGVLILRRFAEDQLRPDELGGPRAGRVVFTLDLTTADGLFSAGEFTVNPGDLVLVTESPVTTAQTIFGLLGNVLRVANAVE